MKTPDSEILCKVRQWLAYAEEDLRLAIHGMNLVSECPYRLIAYHAQQCTEKHLKAYLVYCGVDFPYTHNISILLELCGERAGWTKTLSDAEELTPYAITARYPGEDEEVTKAEAVRAIEIAQHVRREVRKTLRQAGVDTPEES